MFTKNYSYGYYNTIFPNCISHLQRKRNFFLPACKRPGLDILPMPPAAAGRVHMRKLRLKIALCALLMLFAAASLLSVLADLGVFS